jgi:hypothetical protein
MMNDKKWGSFMEAPKIKVNPPGPISSEMLKVQEHLETALKVIYEDFQDSL